MLDLRGTACVYLLLKGLTAAQFGGVRGELSFATLTIHFDPRRTAKDTLLAKLIQLDNDAGEIAGIRIPAREEVLDSILKAPWLTVAVGFFVGALKLQYMRSEEPRNKYNL
ncbi:hypothetical protein LMH87_001614 [Akanthomyces muscarius]|uniref:Uncharacterized protein n=1 Tax=Akanthomyces muscarius TaxID=2231603 RepID=A0A9W8Q4M8_AKAMU|nr:hypothetical protein LMH87_001614 [Akanthomyces muscarius]KAJ4147062.1 hypothetical protein LMH87_001614 [Akanthomyces muscarius]